MADWGIDYLAFSAHKAYPPFGTGALGQIAGAPKAKVAKGMRRQMDAFAAAVARRVYTR
jgi:hypothetical protein